MSAADPGQADPPPKNSLPANWAYDQRTGELTYIRKPEGIPDVPLVQALRRQAEISLIVFLLGLVLILVVFTFGWGYDNFGFTAAAGHVFAFSPIRRGYRLRAMLTFAVASMVCLVLVMFLGVDRLPEPWGSFLGASFAYVVGIQVALIVVYRRWRPPASQEPTTDA